MLKYKYIIIIKHREAILSNGIYTRKLLWFEISEMLIAVFKNKFIVLSNTIFGTLSFPIGGDRSADGNISFRGRRGDTSLKLHFRDPVDNNYTLRARISEQ